MSTTNRPPLWQLMKDAYLAPPTTATEGQCWAAEIRAVADWLLPETEPENRPLEDQIAWTTRYNLRQQLLGQADRAERGD
jgi:hypothetical protein